MNDVALGSDEKFMREAIGLAMKAEGLTSPNPIVGAVIVEKGCVVGRGFHRKGGGPHAEIEALRNVGRKLSEATIYVTLEPCSTTGKTPPCTDAILDARLRRVVIGAVDPNPLHSGKGIQILKKSGIEVTLGVLEKECEALNPEFNARMKGFNSNP